MNGSRLAPLEPIAACWSRAPKMVSLQDWIRGQYILLLGTDEANRATLDAVNRIFFKRASELVLAGSESTSRTTSFYLDEVREAGKLPGLSSLLTKGRSRGASVVMNFQDIEGMRDAYGDKVAHELLGQCSQASILRLHSPATAQWASELLGDYEVREVEISVSGGPGGNTTTKRQNVVKRQCVLPSELLSLPPASPANGVHGYHLSAYAGAWFVRLPGNWIDQCLMPRRREVPNFIPRPGQHQYLLPWNETDLARLKLPLPGQGSQAGPSANSAHGASPGLQVLARKTS